MVNGKKQYFAERSADVEVSRVRGGCGVVGGHQFVCVGVERGGRWGHERKIFRYHFMGLVNLQISTTFILFSLFAGTFDLPLVRTAPN